MLAAHFFVFNSEIIHLGKYISMFTEPQANNVMNIIAYVFPVTNTRHSKNSNFICADYNDNYFRNVSRVSDRISYNDHDTPQSLFTTWETFKRKRENINKSEIQLLFMSLRLISPTTAAMRRGRWLSFTLVSGRDCSRSVNCREHACTSIGIKCWITIGKYTGRLVLLQPWRSQLAPSSFRRHCKWVPRP